MNSTQPSLELPAAVLLRQRQRGRRRVHGDAVGELPLAGQLQPLEPVPVRAGKQVLRHRRCDGTTKLKLQIKCNGRHLNTLGALA